MAKPEISTKRLAIDKAKAQMVIIVAIASFVTVFCLVAARAVWVQNRYQGKVVAAKEKAHRQLQDNLKAFDSLRRSYNEFNSAQTNIIGGSNGGTGDNDGDNAKIVLDSLPSNYDFPALTSSIEKILTDRNFKTGSLTGTDDQLNQQNNNSSPTPQVVNIPFTFTVTHANYASVGDLIKALEHSIRPMQINSINLTGGVNDMSVTVNAQTYFQPAKSVNISKQVVK